MWFNEWPIRLEASFIAYLQYSARMAIYVACSNGIPGPVAVAPGGVALLAAGGGFVLLWARVVGQLHLPPHVVGIDHTSVLIGGCVVCVYIDRD